MTNDLRELQRRLEQATARCGSAEDSLKPETAALRAGWLALGELLEASQPQADPPLPRLLLPPAERRRRWPAVTMAVLAASLLVATAVVWSVQGTKPAATPLPLPSDVADSGMKPGSSLADQTPPRTTQQTPDTPSNVATWDDSLDQQITAVTQAMVSVQQDWHAQAGGLIAIEYQLQQIRQDMEGDTL